MLNNDVIRSLRYILDINDPKIIAIIKLAGPEIAFADLQNYLKKEDEAGFVACPDPVMANFLDGLVFFKRGKDESRPANPCEIPITNNVILKKLRVAFELQEDDLFEIFANAEFKIGKAELSALLRKRGHRNYRECGDQVLRYFLKGLTKRIRP